jgi:signal transduction histidine kinase
MRTSLFTPFRSSKDGGWGIGLFQARDIIQRHGGMIAVTSTPGRGTTFRVRLPVAGEAVAGMSGAWREGPA